MKLEKNHARAHTSVMEAMSAPWRDGRMFRHMLNDHGFTLSDVEPKQGTAGLYLWHESLHEENPQTSH